MFTLNSRAAEAGHQAGHAVLAGSLEVEAAGDLWLKYADDSHAAGQAFLRAFDATGAQR
jgi:hypothetical protein